MNNLYRSNTENRGAKAPHKNKVSFKEIKNNTIHSLNEVECFLENLNHFFKYIKLYKILR